MYHHTITFLLEWYDDYPPATPWWVYVSTFPHTSRKAFGYDRAEEDAILVVEDILRPF